MAEKKGEKKGEKSDIRPVGYIKIVDDRGGAYLPKQLREEVGVGEGEKDKIPFFMNANSVLLIRKGATKEDVLEGLDILKRDLNLRWKETGI